MLHFVHDVVHYYNDLMNNKSDPRVNNWPMMSSPVPTVLICLAYVYISKTLGPKLMDNRKPFILREFLIVYNFIQTLFSLWMFLEFLRAGWWGHYSYRCQPVDYSYSELGLRMANICWWYYFSKFTEFFDTFFFILRKKNQQISTLHVIHHGCMPFSVWMGLKFAPGGHSTFFAMVNALVHIVMYFYYMVSAMGPKYQKYIWWKKYLTAFQMLQFTVIMIHQFQLLFIECSYPKGFMVWISLHGILFFFLFSDFYKNNYISKGKKPVSNGFCMSILNDNDANTSSNHRSSTASNKSPYLVNSYYKESYQNGITNGYVSVENLVKNLETTSGHKKIN